MARVAFVTGGTRGIGRAICERLTADGMKVAAGYSGNEEAAQACARELGVMVVKGNVGAFEDCDRAVRAVEAELGPVDVLVNNAGITRDGAFHKMSPTQWSDVIRVNMDSVFNMTRQVIGGMREREWGRIVNISSINGQKGQAGQTNYAAAKAGVAGMTRALARELGSRQITVNCVAPGFIATDMTAALSQEQQNALQAQIPLGHLGQASDVAHAVAYLASPQASYVTGQELHINGGMYM
jgi:acetoacetyl-CoA reductase